MTRAEELAAIARYIERKGVTRCPTAHTSADLSFISLFRNRERAGVKHEPSNTEALQRRYAMRGGNKTGEYSRLHAAYAEAQVQA